MNWSQENCPIDDHRLNLRGMGKGIEGIQNVCTMCKCFCDFMVSIFSSFPFAGKELFVLSQDFPYGFVFGSIGKHCSYISFIYFRAALRLGPGGSPASLLFFVKRFSPWFQLYGETLLIHFYLRRVCGGPPKRILEASFFP